MAQGTLAVQLTIGGAEPITSGKVVISDDTGQELYTLYTNESGKTIPVTLEAPPAEYSLGVGEPQPYSSYNIRITADGKGILYLGIHNKVNITLTVTKVCICKTVILFGEGFE